MWNRFPMIVVGRPRNSIGLICLPQARSQNQPRVRLTDQ
jgi:hypothetical protein